MISVHHLPARQNEVKSAASVAKGKRNFTEESIRMEKLQAIQQRAVELFEKDTDWATFFREVLGVNGIVHRTYYTPESLAEFEKTAQYQEIQGMLSKLREKNLQVPVSDEPTRVITVRLPKSLHEALRAEAHNRQTSMNQLCISKLLQIIDQQFVPAEV
jgi:predicted HicB family RNase H-like nuclease